MSYSLGCVIRTKMKRLQSRIRIILGLTLIGFVSGCTPAYHAVFVNNTKLPLVVILLDHEGDTALASCVVPPGKTSKMEAGEGQLLAFDVSRTYFYRRKFTLVDPTRRYLGEGERVIHVLLTEGGIHRIPTEFRNTWPDHLSEIAEDTDANPKFTQ